MLWETEGAAYFLTTTQEKDNHCQHTVRACSETSQPKVGSPEDRVLSLTERLKDKRGSQVSAAFMVLFYLTG